MPPPPVLNKALSPFGYAGGAASSSGPWTSSESTVFHVTAQQAAQQAQQAAATLADTMSALKQAYIGKEDTMPAGVKELLEKQEQESQRNATRQLHQATTSLGKARKQLGEINEAKKTLRNQWLAHLAESATAWEKQLQEYRQQLAALQGQSTKAYAEVTSARKLIHQLNSKTASEALPELPEEPDEMPADSFDKEEEQARKNLHDVLKAFAGSVGVDAIAVPETDDEDFVEPKEKQPKRGHSDTAS